MRVVSANATVHDAYVRMDILAMVNVDAMISMNVRGVNENVSSLAVAVTSMEHIVSIRRVDIVANVDRDLFELINIIVSMQQLVIVNRMCKEEDKRRQSVE